MSMCGERVENIWVAFSLLFYSRSHFTSPRLQKATKKRLKATKSLKVPNYRLKREKDTRASRSLFLYRQNRFRNGFALLFTLIWFRNSYYDSGGESDRQPTSFLRSHNCVCEFYEFYEFSASSCHPHFKNAFTLTVLTWRASLRLLSFASYSLVTN